MVGKKPPDLGFGLDPASVEDLRENLRRHGIVRFERSIETRDGRTLPVAVTGSLVKFENQEYFCWFTRDITERRKAEAALKQAFHEIEQLKIRLQDENVYSGVARTCLKPLGVTCVLGKVGHCKT